MRFLKAYITSVIALLISLLSCDAPIKTQILKPIGSQEEREAKLIDINGHGVNVSIKGLNDVAIIGVGPHTNCAQITFQIKNIDKDDFTISEDMLVLMNDSNEVFTKLYMESSNNIDSTVATRNADNTITIFKNGNKYLELTRRILINDDSHIKTLYFAMLHPKKAELLQFKQLLCSGKDSDWDGHSFIAIPPGLIIKSTLLVNKFESPSWRMADIQSEAQKHNYELKSYEEK